MLKPFSGPASTRAAAVAYASFKSLCIVLGVDPQAAVYAIAGGLDHWEVWRWDVKKTVSLDEFEYGALKQAYKAGGYE